MHVLVQWSRRLPGDWEPLDASDWADTPARDTPRGVEVLDDAPGWVTRLRTPNFDFCGYDHYAIEQLPDGGERTTCWNDDPDDLIGDPTHEFYARVVTMYPCAPDPRFGGAWNAHRWRMEVYGGPLLTKFYQDNPTEANGSGSEIIVVRPWAEFVPPPAAVTRHGIWLPDALMAAHDRMLRPVDWREWTEGVPAEEVVNGRIREQRPLGRYDRPKGTKTFGLRTADEATGIHPANHENQMTRDAFGAGETEDVVQAGGASNIGWVWTTLGTEPDSADWPSGNYRCSLDVSAAGADQSFGLRAAGGAGGHFARVNSGLTTELEQKTQVEALFTGAQIHVATTGTFDWAAGAAGDRFECACAITRAANHGNQATRMRYSADAFADGPWTEVAPAPIVGTSNAAIGHATGRPPQRNAFFANGRYWVFFADGGDLKYATSTDGTTWGAEIVARSPIPENRLTYSSIHFDGTFLHYAIGGANGNDGNVPIVYRRGTPNSDGTITWSAVEQTAVAAEAFVNTLELGITTDSNGNVWITWEKFQTNLHASPGVLAFVTKNANTDGTWSTAADFPFQYNVTAGSQIWTALVPLSAGKVYVFWWDDTGGVGANGAIFGRLWDGSWGSEEGDLTADEGFNFNAGLVSMGSNAGADEAYLAFSNDTTVRFRRRTIAGGWQALETVRAGSLVTAMTVDPSAGEVYLLIRTSSTALVYRKRSAGGVWDAADTAIVETGAYGNIQTETLQASAEDYGNEIVWDYVVSRTADDDILFNQITTTAGTQTVTPAAAVAALTATVPAVVKGALTLLPAAAVAACVATTPAVQAGPATLTPTPAVATMAATTPTVQRGAVTVTPASVVATMVATTPAVSSGVNLTPAPAVAVLVAITPTVIKGAVIVLPAPAIAALAATTPTVIKGAVTITPAAAIATMTATAPTIFTGITLTPSPAAATLSAPAPSVQRGTVTLTPTPAAVVLTATAPTVFIDFTATPTPAVAAMGATTPTVFSGRTVSPTPALATITATAPTVLLGPVTVSPTPAVATMTVPAPNVQRGAVTITSTPAVAVMSATAPTLTVGGEYTGPGGIAGSHGSKGTGPRIDRTTTSGPSGKTGTSP